MEHIIAGRFQTRASADAAIAVLVRHVARSDMCIFHGNPHGQHGTVAENMVENVNPGPQVAEKSAPSAAPAADVIGIDVRSATTLAVGGVILAVRITRQTSKQLVVSDLRNCGAETIEQADGEWRDSGGADFNPVQEPRQIAA